jgi:hypothetical protein
MEDSTLIQFKAITSFVKDLNEVFGKMQKSLALYARLLEKTGIMNTGPIHKHIEGFKFFCINNREAIRERDVTKISQPRITYSGDKVFIDVPSIFKLADNDTKKVIWSHILTISALVDPENNAKKILKENLSSTKVDLDLGEGKESEFLTNLISKVESSIKPEEVGDNPMNAVSSLMSSGVLPELIGSMQNGLTSGELDLSKLMGTVQGLMGQMGGSEGMQSAGIDLNAMMGMMSGMMGGGGSQPVIEEVDEVD